MPIDTDTNKSYGRRRKKRRRRFTSGTHSSVQRGNSNNFVFKTAILFKKMLASPWIVSAPMTVMLLLASLDFYVAINNVNIGDGLIFTDRQKTQDADGRAAAESLKRWFFFTCYVATIALAINHYKAIVRAIRSNKTLFLIPPILLTGIFISINPIGVMTNTLQIVVGILAAALLALAHHSRENSTNLYSSVMLATSPIIICSLGLLLLIQLNPVEFILSNKRFGGFAGNPNTLGSISAISIWASLALLSTYRLSFAKKLFIAINIASCILCIALSGSGTSIVVVVLTVLVFGWFLLSSRLSSNKTLGLYALTIVIATLSFIALLTVYTPEQVLEKIYGQLGKDSTMTGRTDLWEIALEAIRQKWLLGWGFDSHQSVMADPLFHINYNHFHNGFFRYFSGRWRSIVDSNSSDTFKLPEEISANSVSDATAIPSCVPANLYRTFKYK